jgi:hypothetical protein
VTKGLGHRAGPRRKSLQGHDLGLSGNSLCNSLDIGREAAYNGPVKQNTAKEIKMIDIIEETRLLLINGSMDQGHGRMCRFFEIGERGVKTYKSFTNCQDAHTVQRTLSDYGVTPKVRSDIFKIEDGWIDLEGIAQNSFAFETEVVDEVMGEDEFYDGVWSDEIEEMESVMWGTGWVDVDKCYFNLGLLDGQLLTIDTGSIRYDLQRARRGLIQRGVIEKESGDKSPSINGCPCSQCRGT